MDLGGLLCLFDAEAQVANAVKDSQRTKTTPDTARTLSLIWGSTALPGRAAAAEAWYRELLEPVEGPRRLKKLCHPLPSPGMIVDSCNPTADVPPTV